MILSQDLGLPSSAGLGGNWEAEVKGHVCYNSSPLHLLHKIN